jgi:hypothetical protein
MQNIQMQYLTDNNGKQIAVVLPIKFWNEIFPQDETEYLKSSKIMKKRILEARQRTDGIEFEVLREKRGI